MREQTSSVIGSSSGMGLEVARQSLKEGSRVMLVGRSHERLNEAKVSLDSNNVSCFAADIGSRNDMERLFEEVGPFDHLAVTAADLP